MNLQISASCSPASKKKHIGSANSVKLPRETHKVTMIVVLQWDSRMTGAYGSGLLGQGDAPWASGLHTVDDSDS